METGHRYRITVAQVVGCPERTFTVAATYERDRRGGMTLEFRRDDDTTFQVLAKCITAYVEEGKPLHSCQDARRYASV